MCVCRPDLRRTVGPDAAYASDGQTAAGLSGSRRPDTAKAETTLVSGGQAGWLLTRGLSVWIAVLCCFQQSPIIARPAGRHTGGLVLGPVQPPLGRPVHGRPSLCDAGRRLATSSPGGLAPSPPPPGQSPLGRTKLGRPRPRPRPSSARTTASLGRPAHGQPRPRPRQPSVRPTGACPPDAQADNRFVARRSSLYFLLEDLYPTPRTPLRGLCSHYSRRHASSTPNVQHPTDQVQTISCHPITAIPKQSLPETLGTSIRCPGELHGHRICGRQPIFTHSSELLRRRRWRSSFCPEIGSNRLEEPGYLLRRSFRSPDGWKMQVAGWPLVVHARREVYLLACWMSSLSTYAERSGKQGRPFLLVVCW
ncbi:hypothetical protein KSP40_PGU006259 [Platanthera guangdongensis]|uniref:Uncharacterized protein n=1 Tax=Platanthera guangdongensis TaxID=2320717 RepID=A0ABR2M755_9ASPA